MLHNTTRRIILFVLWWSWTSALAGAAEGLKVHVGGIKALPGEIGVAVYNSNTGYPLHLEHAYALEWRELDTNQEAVDVVFDSIPSGQYAVSVLHDENGNRTTDRNSQAFPQEGVGFSNGPKVTHRVPRFHESAFTFSADETKEIALALDYETGQRNSGLPEEAPGLSQKADGQEGLVVRVEGIRSEKGELGVAVFNNKIGYPTDLKYVYDAEWIGLKPNERAVEAAFDALPEGKFAVSVFHDENGNRKLEKNFMGFPQEGVAFSNDQKVVWSAPKFEKSSFPLSQGEHKKITVLLDYRTPDEKDDQEVDAQVKRPEPQTPEARPEEMAKGLVVRVEGIRNSQGQMGAALFNEKRAYLLNLRRAYELQWAPLTEDRDSFKIVFDSIPAGEYAVAVFHDENGNSRMELNHQGFPKEGVGFSNNQKLLVGAPPFTKCKVALLPGESKTISVTLDYKERSIH